MTQTSNNNKRIAKNIVHKETIASINKRETWIDWSKAILIWLMVVGHAGLSGIPREFIYAFHMPAFFIISGYLYKPHNWTKTLKSFVLPILFFSLINLCYVVLRIELKGETIIISDLLSKAAPPYWRCNLGDHITLFRGVWFIVVLFLRRLIIGDIPVFSYVRKWIYWITPPLILHMTLEPLFDNYTSKFHDFYVYKVIGCLPIMLFGIILKTYKERFFTINKVGMLILFVIYVFLVLFNGDVDMWIHRFGDNYILFYVCALVASILLFNACKILKSSKYAETFSKGTFLILGLHSIIIEICDKVFDILNLPHLCVISSLVVMLLCYYPIRLALRYCPVILGK